MARFPFLLSLGGVSGAAPPPPTLQLLTPDGGESWALGTLVRIAWHATDVVPATVHLDLSRDGGGTWESLFVSTGNDRVEAWTVTGAVTTQARVRITDPTNALNTDTSTTNFIIFNPTVAAATTILLPPASVGTPSHLSEVDLCSSALRRLGVAPITSLSDNSEAARLCADLYPKLRDELLRSNPWNFATRRAALAQLATAPAWGFGARFQLPTDCLRVLRTDEPGYPFRVEGRELLTDATTVNLLYLLAETDPTRFDSLFAEALTARLAAEMAYPLARNANLTELMYRLYASKLQLARTINGQEGTVHRPQANSLLDVR